LVTLPPSFLSKCTTPICGFVRIFLFVLFAILPPPFFFLSPLFVSSAVSCAGQSPIPLPTVFFYPFPFPTTPYDPSSTFGLYFRKIVLMKFLDPTPSTLPFPRRFKQPVSPLVISRELFFFEKSLPVFSFPRKYRTALMPLHSPNLELSSVFLAKPFFPDRPPVESNFDVQFSLFPTGWPCLGVLYRGEIVGVSFPKTVSAGLVFFLFCVPGPPSLSNVPPAEAAPSVGLFQRPAPLHSWSAGLPPFLTENHLANSPFFWPHV